MKASRRSITALVVAEGRDLGEEGDAAIGSLIGRLNASPEMGTRSGRHV
jgi:hypothetical protein